MGHVLPTAEAAERSGWCSSHQSALEAESGGAVGWDLIIKTYENHGARGKAVQVAKQGARKLKFEIAERLQDTTSV